MDKGKKTTLKINTAEVFMIIAIIIAIAFFIIAAMQNLPRSASEQLTMLSEGWYRLEDGKRIEVSLPSVIKLKDGEHLILFNEQLDKEHAGNVLTTKGAQYDLKIAFNHRILYQYEDTEFRRNEQMKARISCDAVLPKSMRKGTLCMHYSGAKDGRYHLSPVYVGSGSAVMSYHYAVSAITIGIAFLMTILGIFATGVAIYLRHIDMYDHRFMDAACFLFICSIWCFTDSPIVQQESNYTFLNCFISFYAFMLLAVPMLHFVKNTAKLYQYKAIDWCIYSFYINAIMQGLLNYWHIFDYVQMLFVTHLLLIIGIAVSSHFLYKEYKLEQGREIRTILIAFVLMAASGVVALLLYWILKITYYEVLFEGGILIFVALLLSGLIITMAENLRFKTEMLVYQRLAKEDKLTGIGNRRAYDEYLAELQTNIGACDDAALIFMDLNDLKYVNDNFGHNAGDELIIATARCIENIFGNEGKCYRIGGDEFCAVIVNPIHTQNEWFDKMDTEIHSYNSDSRYKMSIARGISYLRKEDGTLKSISDWKFEADQEMYKNKGWKRRL